MKRILTCLLFIFTVVSACAVESFILLPKAEIGESVSLRSALAKRQSQRAFADQSLPLQTLSNLLWAAAGSNRENGKRTIPAAMGRYAITLYVILPEGIYRYDRDENALKLVTAGDYRDASDSRKMGISAGAVLLMAANHSLFGTSPLAARFIGMEAGAMMQNLYLVAAAEDLHAVACASFQEKRLNEALKLPENHSVWLTMVIGFPPPEKK